MIYISKTKWEGGRGRRGGGGEKRRKKRKEKKKKKRREEKRKKEEKEKQEEKRKEKTPHLYARLPGPTTASQYASVARQPQRPGYAQAPTRDMQKAPANT